MRRGRRPPGKNKKATREPMGDATEVAWRYAANAVTSWGRQATHSVAVVALVPAGSRRDVLLSSDQTFATVIVKIILGLDAVECDQERTKNRNANIAADLGVPIRLAGASVQPNARHIVPDTSAKESGKFGFDNRQEFCRRYFLPFGHALAKPKQAAIVPAICALIVLVRVLPACRGRLTKLKREPWPHFGAFSCSNALRRPPASR